MNHFDFRKDHKIAVQAEEEVANLLRNANKDKIKNIEFNNDNKYDLKITTNDNKVITVEVKQDFTCAKTGNVGVEFECRGRASGISVSQADLYFFKVHQPSGDIGYYMIETKTLKSMIKNNEYHRIVIGGDVGSNSKNYLFKLDIFRRKAKLFHKAG